MVEWRWERITHDLLDGLLMLVYLTGVRSERVVLIHVNWIG